MENLNKKIEIFIKCKNLKNKDILSKSDPFIIIKQKNLNLLPYSALDDSKINEEKLYTQIWRSETINNNLNPNFA
jgi:hypothetical protein